jgi:para-aminobenzoate synthetase component 1
VFNNFAIDVPKVLIGNWPNNISFSKNKIFIVPFEEGYFLKDQPQCSKNINKDKDSYLGTFEPLDESIFENYSESKINLKPRYTKEEYIQKVNSIKREIALGNIYEVNFCFDFYADGVCINPLQLFKKLNNISKAPFSALIKYKHQFILLSSPERFLKKEDNHLLSQPMKGTRAISGKREKDIEIFNELKNNHKEQNENVMIVDLIRNDLSRIALKDTVKVRELFGVYSYNKVAQMISSIECEINPEIKIDDILYNNFPMGSMTGAPKPKSLEIINNSEACPRGYYSGTIGFIDENNNFDSCVTIRSIFYDEQYKKLSFFVGSAITDLCNAEEEYEECLLKAGNMLKAIYGDQ